MNKKAFVSISQKEYDHLAAIVDLGASTVADAEEDHKGFKGVTRRNGGYSKDLRVTEKLLFKIWKKLNENKSQ